MAGSPPGPPLPSSCSTPHSLSEAMPSFAEFATGLAAITSVDEAKGLINSVYGIIGQGHHQTHLVEECRQQIRDLVCGTGNLEAKKLYELFAKAHNKVEKRSTHELPLLDEVEGGGHSVPGDVQHPAVGEAESITTEYLQRREYRDLESQEGEGNEQDIETAQNAASPPSDPFQIPNQSNSPPPTPTTHEDQPDNTFTLVPILNPDAFPLSRIQEVQAEYYPCTQLTSLWLHLDAHNRATHATADLSHGPVNHLLIRNPRILASLGLTNTPPPTTITLQPTDRIDETYRIRILPGQDDPQDPDAWLVGELVSARHAYLYWLEARGCAEPRGPPMAAEARAIARRTRRRAWDVMREIEAYWRLEMGSAGQRVRERRGVLLGEDPVFEGEGDGRETGCMWV